jgi:hypothetical protein
MELITGVPPAEYGDKSSLVVHIVTKSGLDQPKPARSLTFGDGSFKSPTFNANIGGGSHTVGNFLSISGMRSDRYLDAPEFRALHDSGDHQPFFDRLDVHPNDRDTLHLNVQIARSSFNVPNTYDQDIPPPQDQDHRRQRPLEADPRPANSDPHVVRWHARHAQFTHHRLCASNISTTLLRVPAAGTGDPRDNPTRVAPRHIFDLAIGADNLFHTDKAKVRVRFSVINLTNKEALYNFLSTFTGTTS